MGASGLFSGLTCDIDGKKESKLGGGSNSKIICNVFSQKSVFDEEKVGVSERRLGTE